MHLRPLLPKMLIFTFQLGSIALRFLLHNTPAAHYIQAGMLDIQDT
jgi:hypothetical protein